MSIRESIGIGATEGPRSFGRRRRGDRGVVLLLVLMVIAVLIVLVGQFAYSALLDRKVARNHLDNAQTYLDVNSAGQALCELLDKRGGSALKAPESLTLDLEGAEVSIVLSDEQGKFNVNSVRTPPQGVSAEEAEQVLEALLKNAGKSGNSMNTGVDESVISLVKDGESRILTLGGILGSGEAEGSAPDAGPAGVPDGEGAGGLEALLTVATDGKINPESAPDAVLLAVAGLDDDGRGDQAELLRAKLADGSAAVPQAVADAAARAAKWLAPGSRVFSAVVSTDRNGFRKRAQVFLGKGEAGFAVVTVNELD